MNPDHPLNTLLHEAARFTPFGEAGNFGFEARLLTAMRSAEPTLTDWVARFSWRFSATCLPIIVGITVFLMMQHQTLPDGVGGLVTHWMDFLPFAF